ncbi:unnamed protein product [Alopecurus aequalis]
MAGGGGDDDLKLQGPWASPHVLRVRLALGLKGVSYEYVDQEPQDKETNRGELLLHSTLPVLIHGGEPVRGTSLSIVQYVDEAFPGVGPPLLPDDPSKRAVARYLAAIIDDTLIKAMYKATWGKTDEERAEGKNQTAAAVETLEKALRDQHSEPFFGGDTAGYVDVALGSLLAWVRATDAMQGATIFYPATAPLLAAWTSRFGALAAVDEVMPEQAKLASMFPTASPARRSGRWSDYWLYFLAFVSLAWQRFCPWWRTILFGRVEPEAEEMDMIPWVIVNVSMMAFTLWIRPRTRIGLLTLFLLYALAKMFW